MCVELLGGTAEEDVAAGAAPVDDVEVAVVSLGVGLPY